MSPEKMVHMANQIATFFRSQPGDCADDLAEHLMDYWPPLMRAQLAAYVRDGRPGLDDLVIRAANSAGFKAAS